MIDWCLSEGISVTGYAPLSAPDRVASGMPDDGPASVLEEPIIKEIAEAHGIGPGEVCLAWGVSNGITIIPKTNSIDRAGQNIRSLSIQLSEDEIKKIQTLDAGLRCYEANNRGELWAPTFA